MWQLLPLAQAISSTAYVDALKTLTELFAAHGVYALVIIFLFYAQRRTLKDFKIAEAADRDRLWRVYNETRRVTYVLIAIAIPLWIVTTFVYPPKTVLWGHVAKLRQMAGVPKQPGQVFVDQQVAPLQQDVKFYTDTKPDRNDPGKVTLYWALVEDGQYNEVPLLLFHRFTELVPANSPSNSGVALDPNRPTEPTVRDITLKKKFVVKLSTLAALKRSSFDYQYYNPAGVDPDHHIGAIRLLRNGEEEVVPMEDFEAEILFPGIRETIFAWFRPPAVLAQPSAKQLSAADAERLLPYLGSRDLKQQLVAERALNDVHMLPWNGIRVVLADPKSTQDHALLVHNLSVLVTSQQAKGVDVPPDIRLGLAKDSYKLSDFKTATPLFNSLSETDLKADVTNYYYRGVSNMQTGNFAAASNNLAKYVSKAPNPAAKAVGQKTLAVANEKAKSK